MRAIPFPHGITMATVIVMRASLIVTALSPQDQPSFRRAQDCPDPQVLMYVAGSYAEVTPNRSNGSRETNDVTQLPQTSASLVSIGTTHAGGLICNSERGESPLSKASEPSLRASESKITIKFSIPTWVFVLSWCFLFSLFYYLLTIHIESMSHQSARPSYV